MALSRRDHLVETALTLFSNGGFHATGIDRVLAEAGVAKMTLYNHFRSKDELILAALRLRDERFRNRFMREVERRTSDPRERLLAVFDVLDDWLREDDFVGCAFINAAAEFGDPTHPIHAAAAEHKRLLAGYLAALAREAGLRDPQRVAAELALLVDGAIVLAQVCRDCGAAMTARRAATTLIDAAEQ